MQTVHEKTEGAEAPLFVANFEHHSLRGRREKQFELDPFNPVN